MGKTFLTLPGVAALTLVLSTQAVPQLVISAGHETAPTLAAFAGAYLATASSSNVALIDVSSGLTVARLPQEQLVRSMEASPAGDILAVGTCGRAILMWDVKSRTVRRRISLTQECAESVSFSPDGTQLLTGSSSCCAPGSLQVWDVKTGALIKELPTSAGIRNVVFSRTGQWIAGIDRNRVANLFEWPDGRAMPSLDGFDGAGLSDAAAVTRGDGRYLAWMSNRALKVWDLRANGQILLPQPRGLVSAVQFLDDGRLAYVDSDRLVTLTLPNGRPQDTLLEKPNADWLTIRRDGTMLAGSDDAKTFVWDVAANRPRDLKSPTLTNANALAWSRSGLIAWSEFSVGARAWNERTSEVTDLMPGTASAEALTFRSDGERLALTDPTSIHVVDVRRGRPVRSMELPPTPQTAIAFSADGSRIALATAQGLAVFDEFLRPQARLGKLDEHTIAEHLAFSPDGRWVAAGLAGPLPIVRVWPADGSPAGVTLDSNRLTYGPQPVSFSADSRWLASFSKGSSVMVWKSGTWTVERTWSLPATGRALAFAPQGSRLAIAGDTDTAIWDAATGQRIATLRSSGSANATLIAWNPDGTRLVTAADDGVMRFWNAPDGRLLASLYIVAATRDWLLVAPDGRLDGSDGALNNLVAWRVGESVTIDFGILNRRRVRGLWASLLTTGAAR